MKTIFQIYISDTNTIPDQIMNCMKTINHYKCNHDHKILTGDITRNFIESNYSADILLAYDSVLPYAYKADIARLCILYKFGGWYFDSTLTLKDDLPVIDSNIDAIVFKDAPNPYCGPFNIANGLIYCVQESKFIKHALDVVVNRVNSRYYGNSSLDPTGPGAFGYALATHGTDETIIAGWYHALTPHHQQKNNAFILPDGRILAYGKATAGTSKGLGLSAYGTIGTNSYEEMYRERKIYVE